jgi:uncharacterized membrane-anchored protein
VSAIVDRRRRTPELGGVSGVVRVAKTARELSTRVGRGDIVVIDQSDLDQVSARALVDRGVAAVVDAVPLVSGRVPAPGPRILVESGVPVIDCAGSGVFGALREGQRARVVGAEVRDARGRVLATGTPQTVYSVHASLGRAESGLVAQLTSFATDLATHLRRHAEVYLDASSVPATRTTLRGRHVLVVSGGDEAARQLNRLKHYRREQRPVLVAVDDGVDVLARAGLRADLAVGDLGSVPSSTLRHVREVVVAGDSASADELAARADALGLDAVRFRGATSGLDAALLMCEAQDAEVVVLAGTPFDLLDTVSGPRPGSAAGALARLRSSDRVVSAGTALALHQPRVGIATVLAFAVASAAAVVLALTLTPGGRVLGHVGADQWTHLVHWLSGVLP